VSITVGGARPPEAWTILIGGTGSAAVGDALDCYGGPVAMHEWGKAVWPEGPGNRQSTVVGWAGGLPVEAPWRSTMSVRRDGVTTVLDFVKLIRHRADRIALVGFSHGGWIAIRAMHTMLTAAAYRAHELRLVTVSTPPLRDNDRTTRILGQCVRDGRLNWLGIQEPDDPIVGWAKFLEDGLIDAGKRFYGRESRAMLLGTDLGGIPAHDKFPARPETRAAVRSYYLATVNPGGEDAKS
jgi:hypothetical protein